MATFRTHAPDRAEIVQKAVVAGISALVAVSAPTSLALETAHAFGLTVVGFARDGRGTAY